MGLLRQTGTLIHKNITIITRHQFSLIFFAFLLPIGLSIFYSFSQNLLQPPVTYGEGDLHPIRSLTEALRESQYRHRIVFVNSGLEDGPIDRVIDSLVSEAQAVDGFEVLRRTDQSALNTDCEPGSRAVTDCFGAVVFHGSPSEGDSGLWNYTILHDGATSGFRIHVNRNTNDQDLYLLPLQKAVDAAIASVTTSNSSSTSTSPQPTDLPGTIDRYPFTSLTPDELRERVRELFQSSIINFLGITYLAMVAFVTYHLTGFIATERETGMIRLVDAMMPVKRRWMAQLARIISYHISFDLFYLFGWIVSAIVVRASLFTNTSAGIVVVYNILAGFAMVSFSILVAAFFSKAQLSGVTSLLATILLGILAQALTAPRAGSVILLSLLFAPCNYVYFIISLARNERQRMAMNLLEVPPESSFNVPPIVLLVLIIVQIFAYAAIALFVESRLHGTTAKGRTVNYTAPAENEEHMAVRLNAFTKLYPPSLPERMFSFLSKPRQTVRAVDGLTLDIPRGTIVALLGANGSGKSTTLDAIAGMGRLTSGTIAIDGRGGLGIAPQKNVLWDELTVEEHLKIFNRLKSPGQTATKEEIRALIESIDLGAKRRSLSKTLSGGQKRKLQLGMMLTGGSEVCCVDEVSSGVDPLSRRKIWDILLAERGRRTIILTTHFLDEADILADHISILSKGTLRASGSSVELKDKLGSGYRVHVSKEHGLQDGPAVEGVRKQVVFDNISYLAPTSALAAEVIRTLEANGIVDYSFSGPTIEDVFLQLAEEVKDESEAESTGENPTEKGADANPAKETSAGLELVDGRPIGYMKQAFVMYRKRWTISKTNWLPFFAALVIPIVAAGLTTFFIRGEGAPTCGPPDTNFTDETESFDFGSLGLGFVIGPSSKFTLATAGQVLGSAFLGGSSGGGSNGASSGLLAQVFLDNTTQVESFPDFRREVIDRRTEVRPAGLWLGDDNDPPTLAYLGNRGGFLNALLGQNMLDMLLTNVSISTQYAPLEIPWSDQNTDSLQLVVYFALALCIYPGFFALYPALERRNQVRALQYSNGVRPVPLWLAYLFFDYSIVLVSSVVVIILWATLSDIWYHVAYIFAVLILYGLASVLLAYNISLFSRTQLAAYANVAMYQVLIFLAYIIAFFFTFTAAPIEELDRSLLLVHFVVSIFAPIGSVTRTLFLALNLFSTACDQDVLAPNPAGLLQYGGPILYLAIQSLVLFGLLLWFDSASPGGSIGRLFRKKRDEATEAVADDDEVANELVRVTSTAAENDGLRLQHLTKSFGKTTAVDNVTFGIKKGEVFALLGPNGAGKSTLISMIRGDLKPSRNGGDIFVENNSVITNLAAARANLGVCPQHDALDQMTVREHLEFYARMRGIPDISTNVETVLAAVGLQSFATRMAYALSGGNKRKLSLGIALMGNPAVVLLDEPSSGLDAAAKRIMWKTLATTVSGRSILLTTHSMEEASALASRTGIMARRMLAMGTIDGLRHRFGDALHVHLVSKTAPHTEEKETEQVRAWVCDTFPSAEFDKTYHGQMRFSVSAAEVVDVFRRRNTAQISKAGDNVSTSALGKLVVLLEEKKDDLGVQHYSVSPTTLDQVFLTIVGRHNVQEEGYKAEEQKKWVAWVRRSMCLPPR